jgi:two-component system, NtrC family, sensor histidine kinase HydH
MNRRILIQVTAPAILLGLVLLGACLAGAWYSNRLERNLASLRSESVASLQAAEELEIFLRQLRYHSFLYLMEPTLEWKTLIDQDHEHFEQALGEAEDAAHSPEETSDLQKIKAGYQHYRKELEERGAEVKRSGKRPELQELAKAHPIRGLVEPCHDLLKISQARMKETFDESENVNRQARVAMLLLGLGGPIGGVLCGYGIARGLSRSIYRLSVRVQDMAQRLDQDLASVSVAADGDLVHLDQQLQHVVQKVEEVAERVQRHQREMLRAEQLSAVGQLAASVAHEVRNPLTGVKMLVEAALRPQHRHALTKDDLEVIHGEVVRLEQTVQSFLDFARLPTPRRSIVELREVVDHAIELVRARATKQGVKLQQCRPDRSVPADVDRGQFCTVLVNLFLNALDAMPSGGSLEVHLETSPVAGIRLEVADTGSGIPPEILGRLFTPFASSKPTGTGLGLSISQRIIEEHGGTLTAANRMKTGACFTISLPATCSKTSGPEIGAMHANLVGDR